MKIARLIALTFLATSVVSTQQAQAVPAGQVCGGPAGATCDKGLWCEPSTGACGSTTGVCVAIPRLCFARKKSKDYRPVCGCNSKTYSSDCFRRAYKVAKSHDGKCG
jgi:Kazal-type serine protease inhibitor-like protein